MPTITQDPNDAVCPDYSAEIFAAIRGGLITDDRDNAGAIAFLRSAWKTNNDAEKEAWKAQLNFLSRT